MTNRAGDSNERGRVWVFASAAGEVDTALVATNLGRAMDLAGNRSIVLDAGIPGAETRPSAEENRKADNETEGSDPMKDGSVEPSIQRGSDGFPDKLGMSAWAHDTDLAATQSTARQFDQLRNEYAQVIVAAPPVLNSIIASVVSEYADAVLVVLTLGTTSRRDLSRAAENLRATGAALTGAVLSEAEHKTEVVCNDNDGKRSETVDKAHALTSDR